MSIEVRDVCVDLGGRRILDGISFTVDDGESVAIVGESGAGKSTLGRVVLGTLVPGRGQYLVDGRSVPSLRGAARRTWRRSCQAVFQNPTAALNPRLRVRRAVTEAVEVQSRLNRTTRGATARRLLERVGLAPELADRLPHQISGGQRQRVVIARAISTDPRVLVLDEPIAALDASTKLQVLDELARLSCDTELTTIYITHDLATVGRLCGRVIVLYAGRIVEMIDVEQLAAGPDHPYTTALLAAATDFDLPDNAQPGTAAVPVTATSCAFAAECHHVQDVCHSAPPELIEIRPGWMSRCHFAGAAKPDPTTTE